MKSNNLLNRDRQSTGRPRQLEFGFVFVICLEDIVEGIQGLFVVDLCSGVIPDNDQKTIYGTQDWIQTRVCGMQGKSVLTPVLFFWP